MRWVGDEWSANKDCASAGGLVTVHGKTLGRQGRRPAVPRKHNKVPTTRTASVSSMKWPNSLFTLSFGWVSLFFFLLILRFSKSSCQRTSGLTSLQVFFRKGKCGDTLTACDSDWETVISILTRMRLFLAEPRLSEASRALISVPRSRLLLTWETDTFLNASNWPEEPTWAATFPAVADIFKDWGGFGHTKLLGKPLAAV